MVVALAYCHHDLDIAGRLLQWIGYLTPTPIPQPLLLVVSPMAAKRDQALHKLATGIFGKVERYVLEKENEQGWPASANHMFLSTLEYIERTSKDDVLFLEPDAVPITKTWLEDIEKEWLVAQSQGKHFMGAKMEHPKPVHLSGIAVYGHQWREKAPLLLSVPQNTGWDLHATDIVPHAHFTPLIQNEWQPKPGARQRLHPQCVLYHQCKTGALMRELAQERGLQFDPQPVVNVMPTRYYQTPNASRRLRFQDLEIYFEIYDAGGGSIPSGILATADADVQAAMEHFQTKKRHPIFEITQQEYEGLIKKKIRTPGYLDSNVLSTREWSGNPVAVAAKEASKSEANPELPKGKIEKLEEIVKLEPVSIAQPRPNEPVKIKRRSGTPPNLMGAP